MSLRNIKHNKEKMKQVKLRQKEDNYLKLKLPKKKSKQVCDRYVSLLLLLLLISFIFFVL